MFDIQKMPGAFGADVIGLNLSSEVSADITNILVDALYQHRVLRIRGQDMTASDLVNASQLWGEPVRYLIAEDRDDEFPDVIRMSNSSQTPMSRRNFAAKWHTDASYDYSPALTTVVYAVEVPDKGGETLFADMVAAYQALPEEIKSKIENLRLSHRVKNPGTMAGAGKDSPASTADEEYTKKVAEGVPTHPLVLRHPVTGAKSLYAVLGSGVEIIGLAGTESDALLETLRTHAVKPEFVMSTKAEVGDVLIWDNMATLHSAVPIEYSDEDGERRLLLRVSTRHMPLPYSHLPTPFVNEAESSAD